MRYGIVESNTTSLSMPVTTVPVPICDTGWKMQFYGYRISSGTAIHFPRHEPEYKGFSSKRRIDIPLLKHSAAKGRTKIPFHDVSYQHVQAIRKLTSQQMARKFGRFPTTNEGSWLKPGVGPDGRCQRWCRRRRGGRCDNSKGMHAI